MVLHFKCPALIRFVVPYSDFHCSDYPYLAHFGARSLQSHIGVPQTIIYVVRNGGVGGVLLFFHELTGAKRIPDGT